MRPFRRLLAALLGAAIAFGPVHKGAADERIAPEADFRHFSDWAWFAAGALSGFAAHELGHMATDAMLGKSISFERVQLGPFPFFAIVPCCNLTRRDEYVIASAGFNAQNVDSELILWLSPHLRSKHHAFLKGVLFVDIGLWLGYAVTALAGIGPPESDVNTMARGLQIDPWPIGLWLLIPAVADTYRYFVPDSRWAPWVSIQGKLMMFGAAFTF